MPPAARTTKTADTPFRRLLRRGVWTVGVLAVLAFALEGGEYSTRDVWAGKSRVALRQREVEAMRAEVEALTAELKAVTTDPARLEKIARERYGMVRGEKELLYRVGGGVDSDADSVAASDSATAAEKRASRG